jgi:uncharacterized phage-associated protein
MTAPTTAIAAANEFIELGLAEPTFAPDPMKLQKLLFYAHAWHLALNNEPLFDEDFEAWPWGPVVRNVYIETKDFYNNIITSKLKELVTTESAPYFSASSVESPKTKAFIRSVWESHKTYSGIQLSNATHRDGEPWTIVKEQYGSLSGKPTISNEIISNVFKQKSARATSGNTTTGR